jgi:beta-phosphoglucomutase-like phosphatase (HAD superfamily)
LNYDQLAILWDMDGTLIDTKTCHYVSWRDTLQKHGYDLTEALFNEHFGRNNASIIPIYLGFQPAPELAAVLISEKEALFREMAPDKSRLFSGVESWLKTAQSLGIPQAVASSGGLENIRVMAKAFNIDSYFNELVSGADLPAKPEPDVFLLAAQALETSPAYCVVIEDSVPGVNAAKRAGMKCVALTSTNPPDKLEQADVVVVDFTGPLQDVLQRLFAVGKLL